MQETSGGARTHRFPHTGRAFQAIGADRRVNGGHQQRGGNAFPADVAHRQDEPV